MILHRIELINVGPFREKVAMGPFEIGLNILAAANETGKTSCLQAAARALFDKHTTRSDEIKSLQPAGTALAPSVAVEFSMAAGRFRIEKTFLMAPKSLIYQWLNESWKPVAEGDAADQRLQMLLQSSLPGRGATKPEHWGMLGFLWARQGDPALWPMLDDAEVGQRIRAKLVKVELDPVIQELQNRLTVQADSLLTPSGQSKANGPLRQAEDELVKIETELTELRRTRADLELAHVRYQQAVEALVQLEKEHGERNLEVQRISEQARLAEKLQADLQMHQHALQIAQEKLSAVSGDVDLLKKRKEEIEEMKRAVLQADERTRSAEKLRDGVRNELKEKQKQRPALEKQVQILREELQRYRSLLKLRSAKGEMEDLARQLEKAEKTSSACYALKAEKAKLSSITPAKLKKLEEHTESIRTLQVQVEALGLSVELIPSIDAQINIHEGSKVKTLSLSAGKSGVFKNPQSLDLTLEGWGRLAIRSGAHEARDLAGDLASEEEALRQALESSDVSSLVAARQAISDRKDLDTRIKALDFALEEQLGKYETVQNLKEASLAAQRRFEIQSVSQAITDEDLALGQIDLEMCEATHESALPAAEKAVKDLDQELANLLDRERETGRALALAIAQGSQYEARTQALKAQIEDLARRYPEGLEFSRRAAQLAFVQAEARITATQAGLPPNFDKLPEQNKRAVMALQQIANEIICRRSDRDSAQAKLEIIGGQGLYSRETELEEHQVEAELRRDDARTRAWSARITHHLIRNRKEAATKAVLAPLENRLSNALSEITGQINRRVFLDESLRIIGLGPTRDAVYAFHNLSQGTKEQLLLCLRIALAQELAVDEPQVLILDDVLVNTDPARQERILDVLTTLSNKLQILILTCHPERYRGVGSSLDLGKN